MTFSETLGERRTEAVFRRLSSKSISLIFTRKSHIPKTIQKSLAELMRSIIIFKDQTSALKCMFGPPFFNSPWEISASFEDWMLLYTVHTRNLICQFIPLSFWVVWVLFQSSKFLLNLETNIHEVSGLALPEVSCTSFRVLQK